MSALHDRVLPQKRDSKDSETSNTPRASTSSSDMDTLSKARIAADQEDPYNVSGASVLKETEMMHKGLDMDKDMENDTSKNV